MALLNGREVSRSAWPSVRLGVDVFLTIEDRYAEAAVRKLARPEGSDPPVTAGASGAAGLGGLMAICTDPALGAGRAILELGPGTTVLVINSEGANDPVANERILSAIR